MSRLSFILPLTAPLHFVLLSRPSPTDAQEKYIRENAPSHYYHEAQPGFEAAKAEADADLKGALLSFADYRPMSASKKAKVHLARRRRPDEETRDGFTYIEQLGVADSLSAKSAYFLSRMTTNHGGRLSLKDGGVTDEDQEVLGSLFGVKSKAPLVLGLERFVLPLQPEDMRLVLSAVLEMSNAGAVNFTASSQRPVVHTTTTAALMPTRASSSSPSSPARSSTSSSSSSSLSQLSTAEKARLMHSGQTARARLEAQKKRHGAAMEEKDAQVEALKGDVEELSGFVAAAEEESTKLRRRVGDLEKNRDSWKERAKGAEGELKAVETQVGTLVGLLGAREGARTRLVSSLMKRRNMAELLDAAAAYDGMTVHAGSAAAAAHGAALTFAATMDKDDKRQYDETYTDKIASIMAEFEVEPRKLKALVLRVLDAHLDLPEGSTLEGSVRVPSVGTAQTIKMARVERHKAQIRTAYGTAAASGFPYLGLVTDGGKKGRRQHQDVTVYFRLMQHGGRVEQFFLGMPEVTGTSGPEEWAGQSRELALYEMPLTRLLHQTGDAGDTSGEAAQAAKEAALDGAGAVEPPWLESAVRPSFRVLPEEHAALPTSHAAHYGLWRFFRQSLEPRTLSSFPLDFDPPPGMTALSHLIPVHVELHDDMMHKAKNAEIAFHKALGTFVVHPRSFLTNDKKPRKMTTRDVLFSLARLSQDDLQLHQLMADAAAELGRPAPPQLPAAAKHRLKIVTRLAAYADGHADVILMALQQYNDAYAVLKTGSDWYDGGVPASSGKKATCEHVADVARALCNPRFRLEAALTAQMHTNSEGLYGECQLDGGMRAYRAHSIMQEQRAVVQQLGANLHTAQFHVKRRALRYYPGRPGDSDAPGGSSSRSCGWEEPRENSETERRLKRAKRCTAPTISSWSAESGCPVAAAEAAGHVGVVYIDYKAEGAPPKPLLSAEAQLARAKDTRLSPKQRAHAWGEIIPGKSKRREGGKWGYTHTFAPKSG
jgi:hypothetical protein